METIQIVLDAPLREAADRAAREMKQDCSALIREALRDYLKRRRQQQLEEQERQAYRCVPDTIEDEETAGKTNAAADLDYDFWTEGDLDRLAEEAPQWLGS